MKESYYFSHDYHSRNDGKLVKLLMQKGLAGIGLFWCVVEMLFEEDGYLMLSECERIAFELRTTKEEVEIIINNFELFCKDKEKFWSASVLDRIDKRKERSEKAIKSANVRWKKNANALRTHCEGNAIKEIKLKEKENIYSECVLLTDQEYERLVSKIGEIQTKKYIENLNNYILSKGKKYKSHYATILVWYAKDQQDKSKIVDDCKTL